MEIRVSTRTSPGTPNSKRAGRPGSLVFVGVREADAAKAHGITRGFGLELYVTQDKIDRPLAPSPGIRHVPVSPMREPDRAIIRQVHPHAWLWEPLEADASFMLAAMFGTKVVYLDGRLVLCFCAKEEPWRGMLVCTERENQPSLSAQFPTLAPHPILPKWLYLAESSDDFDRVAERLVALAGKRDPRIGVLPRPKKRKPA